MCGRYRVRGREEGERCRESGGREAYVLGVSVVVTLVEGWREFSEAAEEPVGPFLVDTRVLVVTEEWPRLGVIVMLELREACEFMLGRSVAASDAKWVSVLLDRPEEDASVPSRRSWVKNGPQRRARMCELTGIRSPLMDSKSISASSRRLMAFWPSSLAAAECVRPPADQVAPF